MHVGEYKSKAFFQVSRDELLSNVDSISFDKIVSVDSKQKFNKYNIIVDGPIDDLLKDRVDNLVNDEFFVNLLFSYNKFRSYCNVFDLVTQQHSLNLIVSYNINIKWNA